MKGADLLVALVVQNLNEDDPSLKKISSETGLSISQVFDSLERLAIHHLIERKSKRIRLQTFQDFLTFALPFVIPGQMTYEGAGIALAISDVPTLQATSTLSSTVWVWPFENGLNRGMMIEPFHEHLVEFIQKHSNLVEVLSCIEILRFHNHKLRSRAVAGIQNWFAGLQEQSKKERAQVTGNHLVAEMASIFAETGFRNISLENLSERLIDRGFHVPGDLPSLQEIQELIGESCAARAYSHLGKILLAQEPVTADQARESLKSFFDFLECNEEYFKLGLWFYLERIFDRINNAGVLKDKFFETLEEYFAQIPSEKSKEARAVMFANSWLTFAWFRWVELPRMADYQKSQVRLRELKESLINSLI